MLIIASVGVSTLPASEVYKIVLAGANVLRINFSYYTHDLSKNTDYIKSIEKVTADLNSAPKLFIEFPSCRVRLGDFNCKVLAVAENEVLTFRSGKYSPDCHEFIPVQARRLGELVSANQMLTIGDGEVAMQVVEIVDQDTIRIRALNNGVIRFMKTFNIHRVIPSADIVDTYKQIFDSIESINYNYVAFSYIDDATNEKFKQIKQLQNKDVKRVKVVIKIEDRDGLKNLEKFCRDPFYDVILFDRGELAVNAPYEKLGLYQKYACSMAKKYHKPIIISTQILESAMKNFIPARSEILDLTNIVLDGADGIMLCQETGMGVRPTYSVAVARKIISAIVNKKHYPANGDGNTAT